jgi:hypothetical protein
MHEIPCDHMKKVFLSYRGIYMEQESRIKQEKEKISREMKEMQALSKQIEEQTAT